MRHADQLARRTDELAVDAEAPAVVRAGKAAGVALVVAANLHAAVRAGVQQHVDRHVRVAREDHALLAHAGDEVVAGVRDLALVTNEQPGAGEDLLLLLLVNLVRDEDLADRKSTRLNSS